MIRDVTVKEVAKNRRWFYEFSGVNRYGERVVVEVTRWESDPKNKYDIAYWWKKHGLTSEYITQAWSLKTYVYDKDDNCWGDKYNPQVRAVGRFHYVNFDWWLPECTEENLIKLLDEVFKRAQRGWKK